MSKKLFFILLCSPLFAFGQNLVPNPSFEVYDTCPNNQAQIRYAVGWKEYSYSPDYFNSCNPCSSMTLSCFSVPKNAAGYQQAATGQGYAGIYTFETPQPPLNVNIRESMGIALLSPLTIGTKYFVSFKASLALDTFKIFNRATNNLGVLFSTVPYYSYTTPSPIANFAHIYNPSIITDTLNWIRVAGSIVADSVYQYISIGNFFDDLNTTVVYMQDTVIDQAAYYFIDDVCVSTDSLTCFPPNGLNYYDEPQTTFFLYPNPTNDFFWILSNDFTKSYDIYIYNTLYQLLYSEQNVHAEKKKLI